MQTIRKGKAADLVLRLEDFFSQEILKMPGEILLGVLEESSIIEVFDLRENTTRVPASQKAHLLSLEPVLIAVYSLPGRDFAGKDMSASITIGRNSQLSLRDLTEAQVKKLRARLPLPLGLTEEAPFNKLAREEALVSV